MYLFLHVFFFLLDDLHLGCYEQRNSDSTFYQPRQSTMSTYNCAQACAKETFPLAAVFNGTECHCAKNSITPLVSNAPCTGSPGHVKIFQIYNATCFTVAYAELYEELTFMMFQSSIIPSKVSSVSPTTLVTQSTVAALNLTRTITYSVDFGDGKGNTTLQGHVIHRYSTTGEFNVTLVASQDNMTFFVSSRTIRVLERLRVSTMHCYTSTRWSSTTSVCTFYQISGSDATLQMTMKSTGQNVTVSTGRNVTLSVPGKFVVHLMQYVRYQTLSLFSSHSNFESSYVSNDSNQLDQTQTAQ